MPTSIHLPNLLLHQVEKRAKRLKISRNHYIVTVLENEMKRETEWSPRFVNLLKKTSASGKAFADTLDKVIGARKSKKSVRF